MRPGVLVAAVAFALGGLLATGNASATWKDLAPGLELGSFSLRGAARVTILRVDSQRCDLDLLTQREMELSSGLSAKQWATDHNLLAATNAGMFATDYLTHVGFLKRGDVLHSSKINAYQSVAAFGPSELA